MDLVLETSINDIIAQDEVPGAIQFTSRDFVGGEEVLHVLVPLSLKTLTLIAGIIVVRVRARKHIRVFLSGKALNLPDLDVQGVSEDAAVKLVERYLDTHREASRE